jgi:hypothetical protein
MSIGNTDWEEYIAAARSKYIWDRDTHFVVYIDSAINDTDDVLDFGLPLVDGGFRGRKANQGGICCAAEEERPSDLEEVSGYHRLMAQRLGCNERLGCFVEAEYWSMENAQVRVFQLNESGSVDSFLAEVEMAEEVLGNVAI